MNPEISIAILAGGQSRRMGSDKSFAVLAGRPLIEHTLARVQTLDLPLLLVTNRFDDYRGLGLPMAGDAIPNAGSLGGLYTALTESRTEYTLCVACDMPFLNADLLAHLIARRARGDAVLPVVDDRPQGLHAVYHRRCAGAMREHIIRGDLRIAHVLDRLAVDRMTEAEARAFDPDLRSFTNVNTPDELAQAERWLSGAP